MTTHTPSNPYATAARGIGVIVAALVLLSSCGQRRTEPEKDIQGRLATVAADPGLPSYFLGQSFAGTDLTTVDAAGYKGSFPGEGAYFEYGTCEYVPDGGCSTPIQVQNNTAHLTGAVVGCRRLPDIRGVPAIAFGGGLTVFVGTSTVTIFKGDEPPHVSLRTMAEALRPVAGPADVTGPLPPPPPGVLVTIADKCHVHPSALR